jgi:hypothetical protein
LPKIVDRINGERGVAPRAGLPNIIYTTTALSRWKSLDFKNIDQEKNSSGLDQMDLDQMDLDTLEKMISTLRTISISISIGLDCREASHLKECCLLNPPHPQ